MFGNQNWEDIKFYVTKGFIMWPVFNLYHGLMGYKREELWKPHYWWKNQIDLLVKFADWTLDAHEDERNDKDFKRSFYM